METRRIGDLEVAPIGLGCMNLSHAYGEPPTEAQGERVLLRALELGVTLFDTAALYGFGANEALLGRVLAPHRRRFVLASKCGLHGVDGKRVLDGRPDTLKRSCDDSLKRLRTDHIDLFYLHRWDRQVPVEDSMGALADLVRAGKVRQLGLSEVSADTIRRAHAVHPVAAVQTEYSLWTRNAEIAVLDTCREIGAAFVAFSPVARGFLTDAPPDVSALAPRDIRRTMPRFEPVNWAANLALLPGLDALAREAGGTRAQLALAWLLARGEHVIPIPGTTSVEHLEEDLGAWDLELAPDLIRRLDAHIGRHSVRGRRYNESAQADVDTETFDDE